jgi:ABC-type branched-subunit amino acid transport system substrate-binding protein
MRDRVRVRAAGVVVIVVAAMVSTSLAGVGSAGAARSVRGFDGSTITIGGMGMVALLPNAMVGAQARVKRFNDTNELKGVKLNLAEIADDQRDPATALSEARRLVSQVGVFAVVPDISLNNPKDYLAQQHVPYFGGGFDTTYCSPKPSTSLWGYSVSGCTTPENPSFFMAYPALYKYVSSKSGKKKPTIAIMSVDDSTGSNQARILAVRAQGSGFKVVSATSNVPATGAVSDFTPYAKQIMTADNGAAPDSVYCLLSANCIGLYNLLGQNGYKGAFLSPLFSDVLIKAISGSAVTPNVINPAESTAGYQQIRADMDAYQPGSSTKLDSGSIYAYASVDAFIQALKQVAKGGKSKITPDAVRKVASTMTWNLPGVMGPVEYPKATVMFYPSCNSVLESNGTKWVTAVPYTCTKKTVSPSSKAK